MVTRNERLDPIRSGLIRLLLEPVNLALGFGALFPQFESENAAQIPTSFGGLVFMMTTITLLGLVIVVEAVPVVSYLRAEQAGGGSTVTPELVGPAHGAQGNPRWSS